MASYGAIPSVGVDAERIRRPALNRKVLLGVGVTAVLAACTLIVLMASTPSPRDGPVALLSRKATGLALTPTAPTHDVNDPEPADKEVDTSNDEEFSAPTAEDVASFKPAATEVLAFLGKTIDQISDETDLDEACGDLMLPCLATVGNCVQEDFHEVEETGRLELAPDTCQCFAQGFTDKIPIEGTDDLVSCSYTCLDAISNIFDAKLQEHNKDAHTNVECPRTFMNMARSVYGSANGEFPVETDYDGEQVLPTGDEKVIRAAEALQEHVNLIRRTECSLKPQLLGDPVVLFDQKGMAKAAYGQYRLEIALGDSEEVFTGRVVHLPDSDQLVDPTTEDADPEDLLGRFQVMRISPDPCADGVSAELAVTQAKVNNINQQKLAWKAKFKGEHHEGVTADRFGMGFTPPPEAVRKTKVIQSLGDVSSADLPEAYDARDKLKKDTECRAYDILDQGSCGSCYAFAAASALGGRICRSTANKWNVVMSPQEMLDCNNGCNGGYPLHVYEKISNDGGFSVENFCDPYQSVKSTCGGVCSTGNEFHGLDGTAYIIDGMREGGVEEIMREILLHGPGVMGFDVYDDFYAYHEGVYEVSSSAKKLGMHAVSVIGWGTENGVDYWLMQNSWGPNMGDEGVWKFKRGTNMCNVEHYGLTVMTPENPSECPQTQCLNGGTPQKDCSCRCNGMWDGASCETCKSDTCKNGGVMSDDCTECYCPPGTWGADCGGLALLSHTGVCLNQPQPALIKATFSYNTVPPPTQKSLIGIYSPEVAGSMAYVGAVYMCSATYNKNSNGGLCPTTMTITLPKPNVAGTYKVAVVPWLPLNEFGQEGYPGDLKPADVFGMITVTDDCTEASFQAIEQANDLMPDFTQGVADKKAADAQLADAEEARVLAAEAAITKLLEEKVEPAASLEIAGMGATPTVWSGAGPISVCAVIPASKNTNPKHLILFVGDGTSGSFYEAGLVGQGPTVNAPEQSEFCVDTGVSSGIPGGQYTLGLQAATRLASAPFTIVHSWIGIINYWPGTSQWGPYVQLEIQWQISPEAAKPHDSIQIRDSAGKMQQWFYTSSLSTAGAGAKAVPNGKHKVTIWSIPDRYTLGGVTVNFHPNSDAFIGAVAEKWIPWAHIGF